MRRIVPLALAGASLLFGLQSQSTRGQTTGTATPTPIPTSTPPPATPIPTPGPKPGPSATQLLARAQQATAAKNTLRLTEHLTISVTGKGSATVTSVIDESLRPVALHEVATASGSNLPGVTTGNTSSQPSSIELVLANGQLAQREGSRSWTCHNVGKLPTTATGSMLATELSTLLQHLEVAGTKTIDGVPSWRIHAQLNLGRLSTSTPLPPASVDIYISRADYTVVREVVSIKGSVQGTMLKEHERIDFSRYGEPVSIQLPVKCTLPVLFSIQTIKIDRNNAKPNWSLKRPSLKRVPAGQKVQLSLYVYFHRVRHPTHAYEVERVYRQGRLVFHERINDLVKPKDAHNQSWYADSFVPWHTGHFRVTATYVAGKARKHKTVWFWVVPRR
jgi:hypothetical protein